MGANSWFDEDNDGWGTPDRWSCAPPTFQFAGIVGDCDDTRDDIYPDAPELCDNRDNNCNDAVDEDPVDASTFFVDNDRDSFGSDETLVACSQPSNGATRQGACDDSRRDVNPDAREVCDTFDNNCNGTIDLDTPNLPSWYVDGDDDSWGAIGSGVPACSAFDDRVSRAGDCDDSLPNVNPGQTEIDDDNLDNDCNGQTDFPTVVSGQVIEDNISWGYADSPPPFDGSLIEVEGNILIAQGATLDIAPCTQIAFADGRALQVEGELIARGEPDCRIVFRSRSLTPSPGDWGRVIFTTSSIGATVDGDGTYVSGSILEYVDIMHSGSVGTGALELTGSSGGPVLSNVGAQTEPWFDVGLRSGADFVDVSNNYWDGRDDPGNAVNDFLIDPSRTVAAFQPTLDAIGMGVPVSYPQDFDATVDGATVTLSWSANPESDIAEYRVWYGLSTDDYWDLRGDSATEGVSGMTVSATSATLSGLDLGLPWRFAVSAVDTQADGVDDIREGHESWPSPVVIP